MNIDHRLRHAARELHETPIAAPPLPGRSPGHALLSKVPAVAASFLMVLGGIAVWTGLSTAPTTQSDSEISSSVAVATTSPAAISQVTVQAISPREELALISSLGSRAPRFLQPPTGVV
jgi:hypothetical protein